MNIVDSSGWLEYFADEPNAGFFSPVIEKVNELVVPTITIYEVFKRVLQQRDENQAIQAIALMQQGNVVDLDSEIALKAGRISIEKQLPMADSIILATSVLFEALLWTQDSDFENIENVKYIEKSKPN